METYFTYREGIFMMAVALLALIFYWLQTSKCIKRLLNRSKKGLKRTKERINRIRPTHRGFYIKMFDMTLYPRSKRPKLYIQRYGN